MNLVHRQFKIRELTSDWVWGGGRGLYLQAVQGKRTHISWGGGGGGGLLKVRELTFLGLHTQVGSDKVGREEPIASVVKTFPPVRVAVGTVTKHQSPSQSSSSKHMHKSAIAPTYSNITVHGCV